MFWIVAFVAVGGAYMATDGLLPAIAVLIVPVFILACLVALAYMINEKVGLVGFMEHSLQMVSGLESGESVTSHCTDPTVWVLLLIPLAIVAFAAGITAIVGLPLGLCWAALGGIHTLITDKISFFKKGLGILLVGLGALVVGGFVIRTTNYLDALLVCPAG